MKNNPKGGSSKIEIELLLRNALRVKQEPSQQLNDSIVKIAESILQKLMKQQGAVNWIEKANDSYALNTLRFCFLM